MEILSYLYIANGKIDFMPFTINCFYAMQCWSVFTNNVSLTFNVQKKKKTLMNKSVKRWETNELHFLRSFFLQICFQENL